MNTLRIAGVSSVGKTTLMKALSKSMNIPYISYGDYVRRFGKENANQYFENDINKLKHPYIFVDDHLEWSKSTNFLKIYKEENAVALCLLQAPSNIIKKRMISDSNRVRKNDSISDINTLQKTSLDTANSIQQEIEIPLLVIYNLSFPKTLIIAQSFFKSIIK